MPLIDAVKVSRIFYDCLYTDEEVKGLEPGKPPEGVVIVHGITMNGGFHPGRLESHREEVKEFVDNLPVEFQKVDPGGVGGGGYSFMKMPVDKNGEQWGEQKNAQELMLLALGLKLMKYCMEREFWHMLPGSVPYVMVVS